MPNRVKQLVDAAIDSAVVEEFAERRRGPRLRVRFPDPAALESLAALCADPSTQARAREVLGKRMLAGVRNARSNAPADPWWRRALVAAYLADRLVGEKPAAWSAGAYADSSG